MRGVFLLSIICIVNALSPHYTSLSSKNHIAAGNIDEADSDHGRLNKRGDQKVLVYGGMCGSTFYPLKKMQQVARTACPVIIEKKRQCSTSNAPNCAVNNPFRYEGPHEFFNYQEQLFMWQIVSNPALEKIGYKGKDRLVIAVSRDNTCKAIGIVRKRWIHKSYTKCTMTTSSVPKNSL